jgi:transposase InsO family protein
MVDDASRYVTVKFMKTKYQTNQLVKDYLTHLAIWNKILQAIQVDRGTKFLNTNLQKWCQEQGIKIQATAPYSPSQNGVVE